MAANTFIQTPDAEQIRIEIGKVPGKDLPPPLPEQARVASEVFAEKNQENDQVAALLGLWTAGMVFTDIMREHLPPPTEEKEMKEPGKPKEQEP